MIPPGEELASRIARAESFSRRHVLAAACVVFLTAVAAKGGRREPALAASLFFPATPARSQESFNASSAPRHEPSPYTKFQALGFSVYTGGAPVFVGDDEYGNKTRNPECHRQSTLGHLGHFDDDEEPTDNLYCYVGLSDDSADVSQRLEVMKAAVERALQASDPDPSVLKVFIAPEFFWRGRDGAYVVDKAEVSSCGPVCQILAGLEEIAADPRFKHWLFLFGTIVAAQVLPAEDVWDYLFLNFAPMYRGHDHDDETSRGTQEAGRRFLVPKRYVSKIDFLTPVRHYNATLAREIIDEKATDANPSAADAERIDTAVFNPYLDRDRYDNGAWDSYRNELQRLNYTLIEYGWLVLDGLVLSVEVCLDHDRSSALASYTADAVTGRTTRVPASMPNQRGPSKVPIPGGMAHLSLVSSAGMTVRQRSIAVANRGYVFLQDGLGASPPRMLYQDGPSACGRAGPGTPPLPAGLVFEGGTELVQRSALLGRHDVRFEHRVVTDFVSVPVFADKRWKGAIGDVFSTSRHEPRINLYPPLEIPQAP